MVDKVISGGQTGVDRAAMDVAEHLGIEVGGWCPKGRLAEDGPIADHYPLDETPSDDYRERTRWNIRDSDGTLVLSTETYSPGTALTVTEARDRFKPLLIIHLDGEGSEWEKARRTEEWIREKEIRLLNVAGPRESESPGIYDYAADFLSDVLGE